MVHDMNLRSHNEKATSLPLRRNRTLPSPHAASFTFRLCDTIAKICITARVVIQGALPKLVIGQVLLSATQPNTILRCNISLHPLPDHNVELPHLLHRHGSPPHSSPLRKRNTMARPLPDSRWRLRWLETQRRPNPRPSTASGGPPIPPGIDRFLQNLRLQRRRRWRE